MLFADFSVFLVRHNPPAVPRLTVRREGGRAWAPQTHASFACRLLFLKLRAQNEREKFAFCSVKGCERIRIKALIPRNAGVSDCTAGAYPRFAERAVVDVPMPRKLFSSQLVSARHGPCAWIPSGSSTSIHSAPRSGSPHSTPSSSAPNT